MDVPPVYLIRNNEWVIYSHLPGQTHETPPFLSFPSFFCNLIFTIRILLVYSLSHHQPLLTHHPPSPPPPPRLPRRPRRHLSTPTRWRLRIPTRTSRCPRAPRTSGRPTRPLQHSPRRTIILCSSPLTQPRRRQRPPWDPLPARIHDLRDPEQPVAARPQRGREAQTRGQLGGGVEFGVGEDRGDGRVVVARGEVFRDDRGEGDGEEGGCGGFLVVGCFG